MKQENKQKKSWVDALLEKLEQEKKAELEAPQSDLS